MTTSKTIPQSFTIIHEHGLGTQMQPFLLHCMDSIKKVDLKVMSNSFLSFTMFHVFKTSEITQLSVRFTQNKGITIPRKTPAVSTYFFIPTRKISSKYSQRIANPTAHKLLPYCF